MPRSASPSRPRRPAASSAKSAAGTPASAPGRLPVARSTVQSVDKALRLLQALDRHGDWLGVRDLSRLLGVSPPAVHSLLKTLQAAQFVEANAITRQYRLGRAAVRLGSGADPLAPMRRFARPFIETLAANSDETAVVLSWQHDHAVVVDWIQADHALAVTHRIGAIEHPIGLASGRVLLAFQEPAVQQRYARAETYARLGPNSPRTPAETLAILARVARDGYAVTENVGASGVAAVGAPVFDANDRLLFAVGCSAPISRIGPAQLVQLRNRLLDLTSEMTARLRRDSAGPTRE